MALTVKDASNNPQTLNTAVSGGVHTPIHQVSSSALPTGAAQDVSLQNILTALEQLATLTQVQPVSLPVGQVNSLASQTTLAQILAGILALATQAETQPVSAAALPLPSGAATDGTLASVNSSIEIVSSSVQAMRSRAPSQSFAATANVNSTSAQTLITAPATGTSIVITSILLSNSNASTGTYVNFSNGSATALSVWVPANASIPVFLGTTGAFPIVSATAATATCETAVANIRISVGYYLEIAGQPT